MCGQLIRKRAEEGDRANGSNEIRAGVYTDHRPGAQRKRRVLVLEGEGTIRYLLSTDRRGGRQERHEGKKSHLVPPIRCRMRHVKTPHGLQQVHITGQGAPDEEASMSVLTGVSRRARSLLRYNLPADSTK